MLEVGNSFTFGYEGDNIMGLAEHHHLFNGALNSLKKLARARGRNTLQKTNVSNEANINTIGKGGGGGSSEIAEPWWRYKQSGLSDSDRAADLKTTDTILSRDSIPYLQTRYHLAPKSTAFGSVGFSTSLK